MAHEKLNEYTDYLAKRYQEAKERAERSGVTVVERNVATARMDEALGNMAQFYLIMLKGTKQRSQATYCLNAIAKFSPGYAEGLSGKVKLAKK